MMKNDINVAADTKPERIDLFILARDQSMTRTTVKKLIMNGLISVNGENVKPNYRVAGGDHIVLRRDEVQKFIDKENLTELKPVKMKIDIIYEDPNIILVNKPVGVVVHPVYKHKSDTLMNGLVHYFLTKSSHEAHLRLRPVHRLDKDTSGIILFAKNKEAHEFYSKLFAKHDLKKIYYAVVEGDFADYLARKSTRDYFEAFTYIDRSREDTRKFENTSSERGLPSRTRIWFERYWQPSSSDKLKSNNVFSLVKVIPETGRTHQIRVHLSSLGFPIIGDVLYDGMEYKRLMLHACELELPLLGSDDMTSFRADLPKIFKQ